MVPPIESPTQPKDGDVVDPRLDPTRKPPENLPKLVGKLDPSAFQANFPQHGGEPPTFKEALQSIKAEDFLAVTQKPCARNGFITGIVSGGRGPSSQALVICHQGSAEQPGGESVAEYTVGGSRVVATRGIPVA